MPIRERHPFFIIILAQLIYFFNQTNEFQSEEEFSRLTGQITEFCVENNIDFNVKFKQRRQRTISTRF